MVVKLIVVGGPSPQGGFWERQLSGLVYYPEKIYKIHTKICALPA